MAIFHSTHPVRFITKLLFIAFIIFICDRGIGSILKHYYFSMESGELYRTTYSIDSTKAEIIILGPSRAKCSYVPQLFEENFHLSCYNAGKDGSFLLYNYAIFKEITNRYNPKLVIFDTSPDALEYRIYEYERLSVLLPYYKSHTEIKSIIGLQGPFIKAKLGSSIYPYNSLIFKIGMGNLEYNKKREPAKNGFLPYLEIMKGENLDTSKINPCIIDENKIRAIKDIIETCRLKNIDLVFVYSPIYSIIEDNFCEPIFSKLCSENNVKYYNFSNHPIFLAHPEYFSEKIHLNREGAYAFSALIIDTINAIKH